MSKSTLQNEEQYHTRDEVHEYDSTRMKLVPSALQREVVGVFSPNMNLEVTKDSLPDRRKAIYTGHIVKNGTDYYRLTGVMDRGETWLFTTQRVKLEVVHE